MQEPLSPFVAAALSGHLGHEWRMLLHSSTVFQPLPAWPSNPTREESLPMQAEARETPSCSPMPVPSRSNRVRRSPGSRAVRAADNNARAVIPVQRMDPLFASHYHQALPLVCTGRVSGRECGPSGTHAEDWGLAPQVGRNKGKVVDGGCIHCNIIRVLKRRAGNDGQDVC